MSANHPRLAAVPDPPGEDSLKLAELTQAVADAMRGLRHGSVEIVVHDARVVQIVRTEKRRLAK